MLIAVWSPKGGSGTSVVAAALALEAAQGGPVRMIDLEGDQPAIFGLAADPEVGIGNWLRGPVSTDAGALDSLLCPAPGGVAVIGRGVESIDEVDSSAGARLAMVLRDAPELSVADLGTARTPVGRALGELADVAIVVVRGCYLALRRSVHDPLVARATGLVVFEHPERPLRAREVADVLQRPVLASVPDRADIARAVDAGVLPTRPPVALVDPIATLVRRLDLGTWGRAA